MLPCLLLSLLPYSPAHLYTYSLSERRGAPLPLALLHTALHTVYTERPKYAAATDACEAFELLIAKLCASPDRSFVGG